MRFKIITALILAAMLTGCTFTEKLEASPEFAIQSIEVSQFETVSDEELAYLINEVSSAEYIPDYNYVDRGSVPEGTPRALYDMYFLPHGADFTEFCVSKTGLPFSWHEEVISRKTEKLSETDVYTYYNSSVTTMEVYTNSDGTSEKRPQVHEWNFQLFLKNFEGNAENHYYTGDMTAAAIRDNFDVYLYKENLLARELTETDSSFIYEYISYEDCSGFWSNFYKFYLNRITIDKQSGTFSAELISTRQPENMERHAFE